MDIKQSDQLNITFHNNIFVTVLKIFVTVRHLDFQYKVNIETKHI